MEEALKEGQNPAEVSPGQGSAAKPGVANNPWMWVRFGLVAFCVMLFYIYNQHHANKALRKKEQLARELKELRSEKISLESEVTNAGKQSELAKKLEGTGIKELNKPPYKIEYRKEKK